MTPADHAARAVSARKALAHLSPQAAQQTRRVLAGWCCACGRTRVSGGTWRCRPCANKSNAHTRRRRAVLRRLKRCLDCLAPMPSDRYLRCITCRTKIAKRERDRRQAAKVGAV